jgi:hypothetical protein
VTTASLVKAGASTTLLSLNASHLRRTAGPIRARVLARDELPFVITYDFLSENLGGGFTA